MKSTLSKIQLFAASLLFLYACGSNEPSQEDLKKLYLENGQTFVTAKVIEELDSDSENSVVSVRLTSIDSMASVTERDEEYLKMLKYQRLMRIEVDLANDLVEIDESILGYNTEGTQRQIDKCIEMEDSLKRWQDRADRMDRKKEIGKMVMFKTVFKYLDGSEDKSVKLPIYFDSLGVVDARLNKYLY